MNNNSNNYGNQGQDNSYNNYGQGQGGFNNNQMGGMGGFNQPKPPIPFNNNFNANINHQNIMETIASGQKFVGDSKKIMEKMMTEHMKAIEKIQHLETINYSLESESSYLQHENLKMGEFLATS